MMCGCLHHYYPAPVILPHGYLHLTLLKVIAADVNCLTESLRPRLVYVLQGLESPTLLPDLINPYRPSPWSQFPFFSPYLCTHPLPNLLSLAQRGWQNGGINSGMRGVILSLSFSLSLYLCSVCNAWPLSKLKQLTTLWSYLRSQYPSRSTL